MPNQVSKEGLTDDQMNENCHLAITEVATSMKKKNYYKSVIHVYACQHFCPYDIRNSMFVSVCF